MSAPRGRGGGGNRGDSFRGGGGNRGDSFRGRGRGRGGDGGRDGGGQDNRPQGGFRGPPGGGQTQQFAFRGPPPGGAGGIYLGGAPVPIPAKAITDLENSLVPVTRDNSFPLGSTTVPGRRGYGTKGTPIILRTNYLSITTAFEAGKPEQPLYRYDVNIQPELSREKRRRLLKHILTHPKFKNVLSATDYANIIVTTTTIDLGPGEEWKEKIVLPSVDASAPTNQGPPPAFVQEAQNRNRITFAVRSNGTFTSRQIIEYLKSTSLGATYDTGNIIQLLNIIMCKAPNDAPSVRDAGRNRFYMHEGHPAFESYDLSNGLEALRGYYSSVRPAVGRLLLNLNVTSGAFYKPMPLQTLINEYGSRSHERNEAFIRMLKVKAVYCKDGQQQPFMTKTKTIVGYAKDTATSRGVRRFGNSQEVRFGFVDRTQANPQPRQTTVFEYFRSHHGITLQQPKLPVLNVGTRTDPQYLPVELCTVLPGQPYTRLLSGDQTSEMLKFAARFPNLNAMSIAGTAESPGNGVRLFRLRNLPNAADPQNTSVQPWGMRTGVDMLTVPGRVLPNPQIKYATKQESPRSGSWNCAEQKFFKPGRWDKWQVIVINRQGNRGSALNERAGGDMLSPEPLFEELAKYLKAYGLTMGQRGPTQTITLDALTPDNRATNNRQLEKVFDNGVQHRCPLFFVVLPEVDRWLYARIKYYGDVKHGIHTINAVGQKLQKPKNQGMFLGNLALKFNIKGGGINHVVAGTLSKPLDNNTMLFGIDVTHPSPGSSVGAPSISCVVASTDEHLTQWPGSVRTQEGKKEMVSGLKEMVLERLDLWRKKHNGGLPTKIILYRDGVSEGQYDQVLLLELPAFLDAFKERYGEEKKWPKMAILVVGKRHHTRFYPTKEADADFNPKSGKGSWNPKPGTIVDRHISGRIISEFWLQAHQGLQGTARPAHYVVLKDDIGFEADELQAFTHNLCYLFNRATKAVSICPPAYYADLLCERARAYLFSVLAEDHGDDSTVYSAGQSEWTNGVHARLAESTWYI
ncbi:hypothetical protein LTR78_004069 [Recurvomyces mirabilis]|uniref:Piwi-domain-containing protein n=1 Tax=Recurvomyces mirabilis TaxID=574656 RepID=A0AAE0WQ96_9PEZI|nr:hypothetical protein LTR78_004069 [Recurvomyces mirabilis]KAK5153759.1 hypothetical protein LTS14_007453 [Recurvomyces mirabilis]